MSLGSRPLRAATTAHVGLLRRRCKANVYSELVGSCGNRPVHEVTLTVIVRQRCSYCIFLLQSTCAGTEGTERGAELAIEFAGVLVPRCERRGQRTRTARSRERSEAG